MTSYSQSDFSKSLSGGVIEVCVFLYSIAHYVIESIGEEHFLSDPQHFLQTADTHPVLILMFS